MVPTGKLLSRKKEPVLHAKDQSASLVQPLPDVLLVVEEEQSIIDKVQCRFKCNAQNVEVVVQASKTLVALAEDKELQELELKKMCISPKVSVMDKA